ncbi:MAG: hypothetical protein IKJ07_05945 [Clostridia bacterium]|nr:hypothetical protein [Clostridia bacterium]
MKKFFALLLAALMVVTLVACNLGGPELSRGEIDGNVYKNEFLGIEFTKPASWRYYSDEEIASAMNIAADSLKGENLKQSLEKNPAIYDMMVVDSATGTNMNIVYENLRKSFSTNISMEKYIEELKKAMSSEGMNITFPDKLEEVKLGDTEFTKCECTVEAYGITMTQVYYLKKVGGYMASVIVTIPSEYSVADIEAMFK